MTYENILPARFLRRPNRFIAYVDLEGTETICHVKNTGRCGELLVPGARVYIQDWGETNRRKTRYDLIAVQKGQRLINMDSQAPNRVFAQWVREQGPFQDLTLLRPETVHGDSRFDFYIEADGRKIFAEVKGVTQEFGGHTLFPDAPTQRGTKHLRGLINCLAEGYEAWAVFIIQMENVLDLAPNRATDPAFAQALCDAKAAGVRLLALPCHVEKDKLTVCGGEVPVLV